MTRNDQQNRTREPQGPALIAWHVSEKGTKKFWTRIGAAWPHKKGEGLTLQLELMPIADGRIVLLPPKEDAGQSGDSQNATPEEGAGA
ncbi:hypothetical protein [Reyranella soli]|uniref:Uncharacterized protein n=1 Tax=Reyranella soli TaxID=1230389 RepID=A0A512NNA2_9HYPH|nr:hypothetical protein [Reyranella soli]GEP60436.1 hypothetical protein RSO01_76020 [Reyranella soli]